MIRHLKNMIESIDISNILCIVDYTDNKSGLLGMYILHDKYLRYDSHHMRVGESNLWNRP